MFKVLHFSLHKHIPSGVVHQLLSEKKSRELLPDSVVWDIAVFSHDGKIDDFHFSVDKSWTDNNYLGLILNYIKLRRRAYQWLRLNAQHYDAVIVRYRAGDLFLLKESRWFRNIFTLHHTKELEEAKTRYGQGGRLEEILERFTGKKILARTSGVIGVTGDIASYELSRIDASKPAYSYPNGISPDDVPIVGDMRGGPPQLIFVASNYTKWHGLDLILKEFRQSQFDYKLHIVGFEAVGNLAKDNRIIFHGKQDRNYIINLMASCDLGLGSFALDRIGLSEACHLKVREYLAAGLPVYSAFRDAGLPDSFPFYRVGEVNVDKILEYTTHARQFSRTEVRNVSLKYIDKIILMKNLVDWLQVTADD